MRQTRSSIAIGLVVVTAAFLSTLGHTSASSSAPSPSDRVVPPSLRQVSGRSPGRATTEGVPAAIDDDRLVTEEDGALPDGVTVFDDEHPGIANLEAALRQALREAASQAADDGIELDINSGWRSVDYQDRLLRQAVADYGSKREAARWVATPDTSPHVSGMAVDIGSVDATAWLAKSGAHFGLCPIYRNEPWHYEMRPKAVEHGCPRPYADPTRDPRMQP